jgi:hypothetical protein
MNGGLTNMPATTRRDLLKGLATLPGLAALSASHCGRTTEHDAGQQQQSSHGTQAQEGWLNVSLHGLWYVEVLKDGITLYAPTVPDHVYCAGWWKQETQLDPKGSVYELKGLGRRTTAPAIDDLRYPVLKKVPTLDRARMSVVVKTPFPDEIHGLRCASRERKDAAFYKEGVYAPRQDLQYLPMNLILCYRIGSGEGPYLQGTPWKRPESYFYPLNLHLRAEPLVMTHLDAQVYLRQALGISNPADLELNGVWGKAPAPPPDPVKPLYGYDRDEELGLGELFPPGQNAKTPWSDILFTEIPQLEKGPCNKLPPISSAAPSNCSHVIGLNNGK